MYLAGGGGGDGGDRASTFSQKLTLFTTEVLAICKRDLKTGLAGESLVIVAWRRDYSLF